RPWPGPAQHLPARLLQDPAEPPTRRWTPGVAAATRRLRRSGKSGNGKAAADDLSLRETHLGDQVVHRLLHSRQGRSAVVVERNYGVSSEVGPPRLEVVDCALEGVVTVDVSEADPRAGPSASEVHAECLNQGHLTPHPSLVYVLLGKATLLGVTELGFGLVGGWQVPGVNAPHVCTFSRLSAMR